MCSVNVPNTGNIHHMHQPGTYESYVILLLGLLIWKVYATSTKFGWTTYLAPFSKWPPAKWKTTWLEFAINNCSSRSSSHSEQISAGGCDEFSGGGIDFSCWDKSQWQNNIAFVGSWLVHVGYIASIGPIDCIQKAHLHSHSTHTLVRDPQVGLKCECEWSVSVVFHSMREHWHSMTIACFVFTKPTQVWLTGVGLTRQEYMHMAQYIAWCIWTVHAAWNKLAGIGRTCHHMLSWQPQGGSISPKWKSLCWPSWSANIKMFSKIRKMTTKL